MQWNPHYDLVGKHAFLSPSSYHWLNDSRRKLTNRWQNHKKKEEGTALHAFAEMAINKRIRLEDIPSAINMFVNDAIGFGMYSEKILYYSEYCFGTADAILYEVSEDEKEFKDVLRVHDLKTGTSKASENQLFIYCALFCLEYRKRPYDIDFICRIYQGSGYEEFVPGSDVIYDIMNRIVDANLVLQDINR